MKKLIPKMKSFLILWLGFLTVLSMSAFAFMPSAQVSAEDPPPPPPDGDHQGPPPDGDHQGPPPEPQGDPVLRGTVYKPNGTTPLSGVGITLRSEDWSVSEHSNTDDQGKYTIRTNGNMSSGNYLLEAHTPQGTTGIIAPPSSNVTITSGEVGTKNITFIKAAKKIVVKVKYKNGNPVTDAEVSASKKGQNVWLNSSVNSEGQATLYGTPGEYDVHINGQFNQNGQQVPTNWIYNGPPKMVNFDNNDSSETKTVNFNVVKANSTVKGTILNPDGSPARNVHVNASKMDGPGNGGPTDHDGKFQFKVISGKYFLGIHSDNQRLSAPELKFDIKDGETKNLGSIKLIKKNSVIKGKITNANGVGIPNMRIHAWSPDSPGGGNEAETNGEGSYTMYVKNGYFEVMPSMGHDNMYIYNGPPKNVNIGKNETKTGVNFKMTKTNARIQGDVVEEGSGKKITDLHGHVEAMSFNGPGGGGRMENGSFNINVVAGKYQLTAWLPPDMGYSPIPKEVTAIADKTVTQNLILGKDNATIRGMVVNASTGKPITDLGNSRAEIFFHNENHSFKHAFVQPDGSYSVSLRAGKWFMGTWIDPESGYMNQEFHEPIQVGADKTVVKTIKLQKANSEITGKVLDDKGNPMAHAWIWADNHMFMEGKAKGPFDGGNVISTHTETDEDGNFSIPIVAGKFEVGAGVKPELGLMNPDIQEVDVSPDSPANITFQFSKPDGYVTGKVTHENGDPLSGFGFVWAWSEKGKHSGTPVMNGEYSLPLTKNDTWHVGADTDDGEFFYHSEDISLTVGDDVNQTLDIVLQKGFNIPPPTSTSFDPSQTTTITLEDGTTINIPANAMSSSSSIASMRMTAAEGGDSPSSSGGNVTVTATPKGGMYHQKNDAPMTGMGYNLEAFDADKQSITSFNSDVTIIMPYTDEQLEEAGVDEENLIGKYWDETSGAWKKPDNVVVDTEANEITLRTRHFSDYAIVITGGAVASTNLPTKIVTGTGEGSGPQVNVYDNDTNLLSSFFAYDESLRTGVNVTTGDLNGDGNTEIITGPNNNGGPQVKVFDKDGGLLSSFFAYSLHIRSGVNVASGDTNGNGKSEIITGMGPGAGPQVKIFDQDGKLLSSFFAYDSALRTGVNVGTADLDGDGKKEIITSPGQGGGPQIKVFNENGELLSSFFAFSSTMRSGAQPTGGDIDGDGNDEIIVGTGEGAGPQVQVFDADATLLTTFFAFDSHIRTGVNVAAGDPSGSGTDVIYVAPGKGGGPQIRVFDATTTQLTNFFAYPEHLRNGVNVTTGAL